MQAMVERLDAEGQVVGPDERVSASQALWSYTVGSAQTTGTQQTRGALAPGMLADYVVLDADPLEVPTEQIGSISVLDTVVDGESVLSRGSA